MSRPQLLLDKSHGWFRGWFRKVWKLRGGGLYAFGFVVTFLAFEISALGEDLAQVGSVFNGQVVAFVIDFFIDSLTNTLKALLWPIFALQFYPPWGLIGLGAAFLLFPRYVKPPITRWLFPDGVEDTKS